MCSEQRLLIVGMALGEDHDLMPCFSASRQDASRAKFRWTRKATLVTCDQRLHFQVVYCWAADSVAGSRVVAARRGVARQAIGRVRGWLRRSKEWRSRQQPRQTVRRHHTRFVGARPLTCDWPCTCCWRLITCLSWAARRGLAVGTTSDRN